MDTNRTDPPRRTGVGHGLEFAAFFAATAFLAFLVGAYVVLDKAPPYLWLRAGYEGGRALYYQITDYDDPLKTDLWVDSRRAADGVTFFDRARAMPGLTLYSSGHEPAAFLIDLDGNVLHEWRLPFSKVWDETSVVAHPRDDRFVNFDHAHLFPNGDLLVVYSGVGDTPWGLGLVKMDKDSRVLWKYLERAHHDVRVDGDGRIYTLTHAIRKQAYEKLTHLDPPLIEDFLVVLSADGRVEHKISLLEALAQSPFERFLYTVPFYNLHDPLHTNAVEPIEGSAAAHIPGARAGDVLLSFRELGLIAAFDPRSGRFGWGTRGHWLGQHDPDLLDNGNILLFDNVGDLDADAGRSRVLEFDPLTMRVAWSYGGSKDYPLSSILRSGQQRLANGNTLITESDGGRMVEVNREGDTVWEYLNPARATYKGKDKRAVISNATRYPMAELDASFTGLFATTRPLERATVTTGNTVTTDNHQGEEL